MTNNTHTDNLLSDSEMGIAQAMGNFDNLNPILRKFFRELPVNIEVDKDAVETMNKSPYAWVSYFTDHFTKTIREGSVMLYGKIIPSIW